MDTYQIERCGHAFIRVDMTAELATMLFPIPFIDTESNDRDNKKQLIL